MRRAESKWRTGDEKRKIVKKKGGMGPTEGRLRDGVRKSILRPSIFQASPDMKVGRNKAQIGFRQSPLLRFAFEHTMATFHCCGDVASVL